MIGMGQKVYTSIHRYIPVYTFFVNNVRKYIPVYTGIYFFKKYVIVLDDVLSIYVYSKPTSSVNIWNPLKCFSGYIPGIYQVYTFITSKPGIYLVYFRYMFSEKNYILIMLNGYMHSVSTF